MPKPSKEIFQMAITAICLLALTTAIFLYAGGYRLKRDQDTSTVQIRSTGMVSVKSIPQGANVYMNGVLATATNNTIPGVEPGKHLLKVVKNGFATWSKEVEVFPELATDITAVLVSQTPRLEPLTNTGAKSPTISPTLTKLAFLSNDAESPGIWVVSLSEGTLSLFKSTPSVVLKDTSLIKYSQSKSLEWSPDEKTLLIQRNDGKYQLFNLVDKTIQNLALETQIETIRAGWDADILQKRKAFIEKIDIPQELQEQAVSKESLWAPDEKKFLYKKLNGNLPAGQAGQTEYRVYNSEKPLPVGEQVNAVVFTTNTADPQPQISWYSDSFHLILTEGNPAVDKRGTIYLIRIDGTNKTEIYNNTLYSKNIFVSPGGDKLVVLTSFKSSDQTDLYTIGLR